MNEIDKIEDNYNRRNFLFKASLGFGGLALAQLMGSQNLLASDNAKTPIGVLGAPHFAPKAKRVIYLFQNGAPSQIDLFDYKPTLIKMQGQELPESIRKSQRLTGMTANQSKFPLMGTPYKFKQHGKSGAYISELLPNIASVADELCFIKTMNTEAINHDPAITFFQTGSQQAGRPSIGSWLSYGLGSDNKNLPAFTVLLSRGTGRPFDQPVYSRLWGNGFLPSIHQGVQFRSGKDPVLYLNDPEGLKGMDRRKMLDYLADMNKLNFEAYGDPEINTRIAQYEMAYRMQTSVPEAMSIKDEPEETFELYGPDSRKPGTFAANCILARRLAERDVKFVQLYHLGWDVHNNLTDGLPKQCKDVDQASAALVKDLKRRGLLDETLVIWGGEFGRTNYVQGSQEYAQFGRDHHPRCFTIWMAGGGIKPGISYGETDEFSYNIAKDGVHVHDFQATLMHLLGIDHEKLTYKFQGRRFRLTDVHGHVVKDIIA
ncbi:MAG: DUF1501 domain-containing protein [Bacteroidota bacterium]|nr:DUF1501 domain-containing protein [Bacteroidota bacterium]